MRDALKKITSIGRQGRARCMAVSLPRCLEGKKTRSTLNLGRPCLPLRMHAAVFPSARQFCTQPDLHPFPYYCRKPRASKLTYYAIEGEIPELREKSTSAIRQIFDCL